MMSIRTRLVLVALVVAATTSCGSGDGKGPQVAAANGSRGTPPAAAATDGVSDRELGLKFAQCVRENGVPDFPDPKFEGNGGVAVNMPAGTNKAKADTAMQACRRYQPDGGEPPTLGPEAVEKLRAYAKCMRANGVAEFPDPTAQGIQIDGNTSGIDPESPRMKAAEATCQKYAPAPRDGEGPGLSTGNG